MRQLTQADLQLLIIKMLHQMLGEAYKWDLLIRIKRGCEGIAGGQ